MTPEGWLREIVSALESVGVSALVMGGHGVRFYGLARNTNDIADHQDGWPARWMGKALEASASGYYAWAARPSSGGRSWSGPSRSSTPR
jgi:hypothetical protein